MKFIADVFLPGVGVRNVAVVAADENEAWDVARKLCTPSERIQKIVPESGSLESVAHLAARVSWAKMSQNQRALVRFGMIPAEIADQYPELHATRDGCRLFAVALMDCAKDDGGMVA